MENLLEVRDLKVSFQTFFGEVEAVRGISYNLEKGKTLAIVGESGCGKSVSANAIMQLLPKPPVLYKGGEIVFKGENLLEKSEKEMTNIRGNEISMVFQDPMTSLNPTMKVGKQIVEGLKRHKKISNSEARQIAIEMLKKVSVPQAEKRIDQYPHEFSGGMRQRVMIAIAMAVRPDLLIADEPTTALDVTVQAQILDLMKEIQKQEGNSIIIITHDLGVVADMADDIIVMYAGQIVEEGSVDEIFNNPSHPYTRKLLEAVPKLNMNRNEALSAIEGTPPDLYKPPLGCAFFDRCDEAMVVCEKNIPDFYNIKKCHCSRCFKKHPSYIEMR
ncbi:MULTISPECIES: ABC transporter ATP-binding protein [Anaerococcus]|uniref:Peptide ABC transporter ATP-binding protein n=1 Tax=Anaerococcus octavius TaxID=54007 RepID=A0A2I1MBM7_9FIRM|nr:MULTISPECIES: ABC transporter ATP-binding protein [Anaerococcus]MBS6105250.1 ABC transporter ATP-binding protein [Anaerococcus sp.]MDU2599545.1 ABC transporter ATP-binding protein [Anaerococcus sp.]MDU5534614.1 ABC transporter ATP-binding protein [Anaerococcus sp.]PKZ17528.1 peptide ABC transporter ATP-binding protein [Anaerococcus octavius]